MDWLEWFGFPLDPFFDKPLETDSELETLLVISKNLRDNIGGLVSQMGKVPQICLIAGERGAGKSTAMYYVAKLLRKEGGFSVYIGLHHTQVDASRRPVEDLKRDVLEIISVEIIRNLSSRYDELFNRHKSRFVELMKYLGYSYDPSEGFLADVAPVHLSYPDLEKHILDLTDFVKSLGLSLVLMIDNLDKVKNIESVQTFLGSAFGQTFFHNLRQRGVSIILAVAPKLLKIQMEDRDLNYLSKTVTIPLLSPNQAINLIEKRIKSCKTPPPKNPFEKEAIIRICISKRGITRDILTEARNLSMSAGNLQVSRIDKPFVESGLVSFNPNRTFYELIDLGEETKDRIMQLLNLQTLLDGDECTQAGSALQSIARGEVVKLPNKVHAALLELRIITQKPGEKRKYIFTTQTEQLLETCETKNWARHDFLEWITKTEGHVVAKIGTPGIGASQSIEAFGPVTEPAKPFVHYIEKNTKKSAQATQMVLDAKNELRFAKKTMHRLGRLSWDDIDSKTVYLDLYSSLVNFLFAFSKLYLASFARGTPRIRSLRRFDLVRATKGILQVEIETSIASWHRILRLRANVLGIREGEWSPSHADLKAAFEDFEEVVNELSNLWTEIVARQEVVPKPLDERMKKATVKLSNIASIMRYSSERPEYMSLEIDVDEGFGLGISRYPTNKVTFDVVRERQVRDENGKICSSFFIAAVHPIQKGRASRRDIVDFVRKSQYLVDLIESKEESLSPYWPRYNLVLTSLNGFERGITATVTATELPEKSRITLLNERRLHDFEADIVSTAKLGSTSREFEEIGSNVEDLLRLRIKTADMIREKFLKFCVIMLADIKEFTPRTEEDSLEAAECVQRLSDIFDKNVTKYGGKGTQTEGDAYVATFGKAEDAVNAALSAIEELDEYNKRVESQKQILVRIGINSGYAIFRRGQPFVGTVINLAARAMREADPGKICVTYYALKSLKAQKGFKFHSLGLRELKGFHRPVDLYYATRADES